VAGLWATAKNVPHGGQRFQFNPPGETQALRREVAAPPGREVQPLETGRNTQHEQILPPSLRSVFLNAEMQHTKTNNRLEYVPVSVGEPIRSMVDLLYELKLAGDSYALLLILTSS